MSEEIQDNNNNDDNSSSSSSASLSYSNGKDVNSMNQIEGVYDPNKFDCSNLPTHVRNLFQFIGHYSPQMIDIAPRLKPFIPDYIPTVGHVDAFIKIPYPDDRQNNLGLLILDEPNIEQSDSTLLQIKLKALSRDKIPTIINNNKINDNNNVNDNENEIVVDDDKINNINDSNLTQTNQTTTTAATSASATTIVPIIQSTNHQSNILTKEIQKWIDYIKQLHETTSRPESISLVHHIDHQNNNNNIEKLMQEWPDELEQTLNVHQIPTPDIDCTLDEYLTIMMAILDIPVQNNKITSLYQMFTLLNEFQNSQHFNKYNN